MEYIAGQDLETLREEQCGGQFSCSQVMALLAPIIAVTSELHRQAPPLIHGDIKPANIVLPREDIRVVPALPLRVGKAIERAMSLDAQQRFS
jgi:serine/threonine protein kinase